MIITDDQKQRIQDAGQKLDEATASLDLPALKEELAGLTAQMEAPDFWNDVETRLKTLRCWWKWWTRNRMRSFSAN